MEFTTTLKKDQAVYQLEYFVNVFYVREIKWDSDVPEHSLNMFIKDITELDENHICLLPYWLINKKPLHVLVKYWKHICYTYNKVKDDIPIKEQSMSVVQFRGTLLKKKLKLDSPYSATTILSERKMVRGECVSNLKISVTNCKRRLPTPKIDGNLVTLSGTSFFTTLDCNMAYYQ